MYFADLGRVVAPRPLLKGFANYFAPDSAMPPGAGAPPLGGIPPVQGPGGVFSQGGNSYDPGQSYRGLGLEGIVGAWGPEHGGLSGAQSFWGNAPESMRTNYADWSSLGQAFLDAWHRRWG